MQNDRDKDLRLSTKIFGTTSVILPQNLFLRNAQVKTMGKMTLQMKKMISKMSLKTQSCVFLSGIYLTQFLVHKW